MDSLGLRGKVAIAGTNDDSAMLSPLAMKLNEVLSVECQVGALFGAGVLQDLRITDTRTRLPFLVNRQNVVAQRSQLFNHGEREVFVGEEPGHSSSLCVLADLTIDVLAVGTDVGPGVGQVFGADSDSCGANPLR